MRIQDGAGGPPLASLFPKISFHSHPLGLGCRIVQNMHARRSTFLLSMALLVALAVCFVFVRRTRTNPSHPPGVSVPLPPVPAEQPVYHEQPLSYWVLRLSQEEETGGPRPDAVEAIRAIGPKAVPFLLNWMPHPGAARPDPENGVPDQENVELAWWALGSEGKAAIPVLAEIINLPQHTMDDYSVWTKSATAISYLGPDAIVPMLTAATNMQGRHELWELLHNFQNLGTNGTPAVPALIHWAGDSDYWVRDGVVSALGGIGQRPDLAVPVLLKVLEHDDNGMVRRDAAEALGTFANDSDAVLPELTKLLKDADWQARGGALSGLGEISDKPDVVIPLLVPFLSDENSVIERSAAYALLELDCRTAYCALLQNNNPSIRDIVYQAGEKEKARQKLLK